MVKAGREIMPRNFNERNPPSSLSPPLRPALLLRTVKLWPIRDEADEWKIAPPFDFATLSMNEHSHNSSSEYIPAQIEPPESLPPHDVSFQREVP
jgi:hypothetical protein